jgi:hypothetical protein
LARQALAVVFAGRSQEERGLSRSAAIVAQGSLQLDARSDTSERRALHQLECCGCRRTHGSALATQRVQAALADVR